MPGQSPQHSAAMRRIMLRSITLNYNLHSYYSVIWKWSGVHYQETYESDIVIVVQWYSGTLVVPSSIPSLKVVQLCCFILYLSQQTCPSRGWKLYFEIIPYWLIPLSTERCMLELSYHSRCWQGKYWYEYYQNRFPPKRTCQRKQLNLPPPNGSRKTFVFITTL